MMKHAYLILAHADFTLLEALVKTLDDARNEIFIHVDKKSELMPILDTRYAKLHILMERIDVRWGDVSVVEAELLLFSAAFDSGKFAFYHLLSGADLPLRSQDDMHQFFAANMGKQFIGFSRGDQSKHVARKVQRYHLFPRHFRDSGSFLANFRRAIRFFALRIQFALAIKRNRNVLFKKGTQWVSLTHDFVAFLLQKKEEILGMYQYTFCADEIFVQTVCWNSSFKNQVYDLDAEGNGSQRAIRWKDNQIDDWKNGDYEELMEGGRLFARKFNSKQMGIVNQVVEFVTKKAHDDDF